MPKKAIYFIIPSILLLTIIGHVYLAHAGILTPPGTPSDTMYTLTDLYNLASGTTGTIGSGSVPATPGSASPTFHTLTDIYTALSSQIPLLSNAKLAQGVTAFGYTGTLLGDSNPANVLTTALYPGTYSTTNLTTGNIKNRITYGVSGGQTGTFTTGLTATNQTICSDASGTVISCTGTGQDGELQKGIPHSYIDNGDGTITDNGTGLVWQKCTAGLSGSTCATGSATSYGGVTALAYCKNNTAGLPGSGWYLPNVNQLYSLVDFSASAVPYINQTYFPNTQTAPSRVYVSSTFDPTTNGSALLNVQFNSNFTTTSGTRIARCVR